MCAEQSKVVSIKAKIRIYKIVIRSTVTANCETLTMTNDIVKQTEDMGKKDVKENIWRYKNMKFSIEWKIMSYMKYTKILIQY